MKKGKHRKKSPRNSGIGEILVGSLTKEQVAHLLNVVFARKGVAEFVDELNKTDSDVAETIEKIVANNSGKSHQLPIYRLASKKKVIEQWDSLWDKWDSVVAKVGDEEGKYVVQDADWEPPYFDGYPLAEDLDEIAKDIVTLIDLKNGYKFIFYR